MSLFAFVGNDEWELEDNLQREIGKWLGDQSGEPLCRQTFYGSEITLDSLREACGTVSLFSEKKAIIIRHGEKIPLATQNKLTEILRKPLEDTAVFLLFEKLDGRSSLKKLLGSKGTMIEFKLPYPDKIPPWLSARCSKRFKRRLSVPDAKFLAELVGDNAHELESELRKLDTYLPEGQAIKVRDIENLIAPHGETNIYDLLHYVGMRNKREALLALRSITDGATPPFLIAIRLFYHCLQLLKIQTYVKAGMQSQEISQKLKINPYIFGKKQYREQAMTRPSNNWKKILIRLSELEFEFKRGKHTEPFQVEIAFAGLL